jgi:LysR family transcriptional activator of nhaA
VDFLNYNHLKYFWAVARDGSIAKASQRLLVTQPTISTQIRALERELGHVLFDRRGRQLVLTDWGQTVYSYANEIFTIGQEMIRNLQRGKAHSPIRINVGVTDSMPKLMAKALVEPALGMGEPSAVVICREGKLESLMADLALRQLDVVLADESARTGSRIRNHHHRLGSSGIELMARPDLARRLSTNFPHSIDSAPGLLPTDNSPMRGILEKWFDSINAHPRVVGEFEDSALAKHIAADGLGFFAVPSVLRDVIGHQHGMVSCGQIDAQIDFYAISLERKLRDPAVVALVAAARTWLATDS